jgi:hypothetical protein
MSRYVLPVEPAGSLSVPISELRSQDGWKPSKQQLIGFPDLASKHLKAATGEEHRLLGCGVP